MRAFPDWLKGSDLPSTVQYLPVTTQMQRPMEKSAPLLAAALLVSECTCIWCFYHPSWPPGSSFFSFEGVLRDRSPPGLTEAVSTRLGLPRNPTLKIEPVWISQPPQYIKCCELPSPRLMGVIIRQTHFDFPCCSWTLASLVRDLLVAQLSVSLAYLI